ncbi:MAG: DUF5996 family protein [Ignavibacteria bacterium]
MSKQEELWPALPWLEWGSCATTVHLFTQIIGKIRLALMPMQAEWAQVPLTVTSRGLTSNLMPVDFGSIDISFDFISHSINFYASDGRKVSFLLKGLSVAEFYAKTFSALNYLHVKISINPTSVEVPHPVRMDLDIEDNTYDEDMVNRWWRVLVSISSAFEKYRSTYQGKQTQISFFWGTFDLAVIRFSGKPIQPPKGADLIHRVAMDAEQFAAGFWPGDNISPEPVFFTYAYPKPEGIENVKLKVKDAAWNIEKGEFLLPYESIRKETDPGKTLLAFLNESYHAGTELAKWDNKILIRKP